MNEKAFSITKVPRFHGNRRLDKSGIYLRELAAKTPDLDYLSSEQNMDRFVKMILDFSPLKIKTALDTSNTGGYLLPSMVVDDVFKLARHTSVALKYCRIHEISSASPVVVPKELANGSVSWIDESGEITASEPTFAQGQGSETTTPLKKMVQLAVISNELYQDSKFDLVSLITEQFLQAIGQELDNQVFNGTGSPVSGLISAAGYSTILTGAFSTITPANITESIAKIEEGRYRDLRFFVGRTQNHLLHSSSTAQLNPWYDNKEAVNRLYGFPVETCQSISSTDGSDKMFGVIGNLQSFVLVHNRHLAMGLDMFGKFATDQTRLRFSSRWGFALADPNSFCRIMTAE